MCCDISSNLLSTSLSSSTLTPCSPLDTSSAEHRHFSPRPPLDPHLGPSADKALAAQPHLGDRQPTRSPPARPTPSHHRYLVTPVATDAVGSRNTTNSSTTLATPTPARTSSEKKAIGSKKHQLTTNHTTTPTSTTKKRSQKQDDSKTRNKKNRSKKTRKIKKQFKTQNQIPKRP